jgi:hypothetical protein
MAPDALEMELPIERPITLPAEGTGFGSAWLPNGACLICEIVGNYPLRLRAAASN